MILDIVYENIIVCLISYLVLQIFLYFVIEKNFQIPNKNKSKTILVQDSHEWNFFSLITFIVEYGVLNRYSFFGYKNLVKNNLRIFSSLMLSVFVFLSVLLTYKIAVGWAPHCPNISLKQSLSGFWGFFISSFIIERKMVYDKWIYLAGLYNKIIELESKNDPKLSIELLSGSLALDILDMEMWSHASFSGFFYSEINEMGIQEKEFIKPDLRNKILRELNDLTLSKSSSSPKRNLGNLSYIY